MKFSCKKMQVHFMNATNKFLSLTVTNIAALSKQYGGSIKYNCSVGQLTGIQKCEGTNATFLSQTPPCPF